MDDTNPLDALDDQRPQSALTAGPIQSNPLDEFDEPGPYERNKTYAKPPPAGGYQTQLPAQQERQFQDWVKQNHIPFEDSPTADYDMRGFWKGLQNKDSHATTGINQNDQKLHFSDWWKTPYHKSFSAESQWATGDAPRWNEKDQLVLPSGKVVYDERSGSNPLDALDSSPASEHTAQKLRGTLQKVDDTLPQVTVSHRGGPESSWSDVASAVMPAIGAKLETKMAGAQESYGSSVEQAAKKRLWQSMILPQAVREAKEQGISLTDHADVVDIAQHLGIRPDQFTRDWPKYANMSPEELQKVQADARERLQSGQSQAETGAQRRETATKVSESYAPNIPEYGLKSLAFSTATMIPDLLAGTAATVATGGVGGAAAMAASIAPEEYANARNRGLNDRDASTYATLSTLASSVPEIPVLKVIENAPVAKRIIGGVVGDKLAGTAAGKVAGTAVTQGVTQSVVQALQTGIDEQMFDEDTSVSEALKKIAFAGLTGAVAGAPMGAVHAIGTHERTPTRPGPARVEPTIGPDLEEAGTQHEPIGSTAQVSEVPQEGSGKTPAKPQHDQPLQGQDLHDALKAVQDKTVSPGQLERLEGMNLATRNDVNVPRLLPAGRRQLVDLMRSGPSSNEGSSSSNPADAVYKPRIQTDQDLREGLTSMKAETGWAEAGGRTLRDASTGEVSGRTSWIPNADWWPDRPKGLTEPQVHDAVDKALAGQPLRPAEQRMVDFMTQVHDERTALQKTHDELQDAVPELHEQPHQAVDLTLLASRAGEHDANATSKVIDSWADDKPETLTRVQGELERIIGRGQQEKTRPEGAGSLEPATTQRSAEAEDLFGEHPQEAQRRAEFSAQLEQARADTHTEPTDGQKEAGNYRKGRLDFAGMEVALENPKGSTRRGTDDEGHPWESTLKHDYGYFTGSRASDAEGVDVFLTGKPDTGQMFVINQVHPETGKYDEAKVVAGARTAAEAESTYKANYSRDWKGLGSMAEMTTERFKQWLQSGQTHKPVRTNVERREDVAQRKKVAEMSSEEAKRELLTHELTDIPNRRAYVESEKLPSQVSIDVDSLKAVNDLGGHHAGDELLKAVAQVLHEETEQAYHLSGDEFAIQALHPREAEEIMKRATDRLKDAEIIVTMPDGRVLSLKGLGVSYGVGEDLGKADTALQAHKKQREAEGSRAPRGEAPRGLTFRPGEAGREDHGRARTSQEEVKPKFSRRTEPADASALKAFADRVKSDLDLEDFELRSLPGGDVDLELLQVPRGKRGQGVGTRAMERLARWADENGRRVTLSLAGRDKLKNWGTTSSARLERFYSQFGFKPNRGRYKDYALSLYTNMYRDPQTPKSRRTEPQTGLPRAHVERIVRETVRDSRISGFPHVEIHEDTSTLPEAARHLIEDAGAHRTTGAVYDPVQQRIHLIASNNGSEREVRENLWHEAVGHHGLRMAMDAPQYNAVMDGIYKDMPERVKYAAERNGLDLEDVRERRAAAEEVIAYAAGQKLSGQRIDAPVVSWLTRAARAVKGFFARMAGKSFYDDRAILGLIKQAQRALETGAVGTVPSEPMRSTRAPMFYSPVDRAVEGSTQAKASADQWLATLKKTAGVKPEELEWLDLENWLKGHKGQITKEELSKYVQANRLDLQETTLGGQAAQVPLTEEQIKSLSQRLQQEGYPLDESDIEDLRGGGSQARGLLESLQDRLGISTHEFQSSLTQTQRDVTRRAEELRANGVQVSFNEDGTLEHAAVRTEQGIPEQWRTQVEELRVQANMAAQERVQGNEAEPAQYEDYQLPGGKNYREMLLRLPDSGGARERESDYQSAETARQLRERNTQRDRDTGTYRSSHWQEPNILAHVRFNERTDPDGKKVLFLEELQSDWHQTGRKHGYPQDAETIRQAMEKRDEAGRAAGEAANRTFGVRRSNFPESPQEVTQADLADHVAARRLTEAQAEYDRAKGAVPDAPFKTSWPMLVMKRMVRWAAENGFERIAWTTGEQQNERYNLEQHIKSVHTAHMLPDEVNSDLYHVAAYDHSDRQIVDENYSAEELPAVLGQDLAEKIITDSARQRHNEYAGLDLRAGGEGMRGFYDQILPRETDKLIKKFGGRVVDTQVHTGIPKPERNEIAERNFVERVAARGIPEYEADDWLNEWTSGGEAAARDQVPDLVEQYKKQYEDSKTSEAHGFDITPEMRTAALSQGFPLFARRQAALPLQQPGPKGAYERIKRAVEWLSENPASRDIRKLFHPAGLSADAKRTAQIATVALGKLAHESFETQHALEQFSRQIDKLPVEDQLEMIDNIERGIPQPNPELQPVADQMRKLLDTWRDKVRGLGSGYLDKFIENYFPHYWDRGDEAARMVASIQGRRTMRGPATFLKMRTIPTIKEGMEAGLRPLTVNPLIMTLLKTREMQRFVTGVTLLRRLKEDGLAQFVPASKRIPDGWKEINDPSARVSSWSEEEGGWIDRGRYAMPEDAARVINNHLSGSLLKDFAPAAVFRTGANMLNALQLGFSAFHLGFTTLDAIISKTALGVERLAHGQPLKAAQAFGEAATGPGAAVMNVRRGHELLKAYANPAGATPQMLKLVDALQNAGGRVQMDRYYLAAQGGSPFEGVGARSLAKDIHQALTAPTEKLQNLGRAMGAFPQEYSTALLHSMQQLAKTTHPLAIPFEVAGRITRASTSWIMEHLVPMQKLGVFADLARDHIERNPQQDPNEQAVALQKVWAAVDDRLGEMVYDNLFLNRTFKDMLHFGIRAVGWNWGTWRSIGGAPIDVMKMADKLMSSGKVTADDLGHKIPYVMAMAMTTALYGAITNYLYTGEGPQELKDYFFPRTGGTTNYGTPQRVSLPSYAKDVYEYSQRPGETVMNKLNPIFNVIGEMWRNEDFFGNPITDPDADLLTSTGQRLQFLGKETMPFSLQGRQQIAGSDKPGVGGAIRQITPYFGITPAPGYVTSPDQLERRERYEREQKYTKDLKYKMTKAYEAGDKATGNEYRDRYTQAIKHMKETESDVKQDRAKAAVGRRKAATALRQQGKPATAELVSSLPLEPDAQAREYFQQVGNEA